MMTEWLEFSTEWGYWINPGTFRMVRVKKSVLVGAVVLIKSRETLDTGNTVIVTDYGVAKSEGVEGKTKKEASAILTQQMVTYMKEKEMLRFQIRSNQDTYFDTIDKKNQKIMELRNEVETLQQQLRIINDTGSYYR